MQDHIHRKKMSRVLLSRHLCIHLRLRPNDSFVENAVEAARTDLCGKTPCLSWNNQNTQSPKNECNTMSTETEHHVDVLHTEAFTHRSFYARKLLHRGFYTQTPLHTDAFTHRRFYIQILLHTDPFTHRSFYTQSLLHTEAFTHKRFCTQKLLHTDHFTHKHFY